MLAARGAVVWGTCGLLALGAAGCGGSNSSYKKLPHPPAPIVVTASISKDRVSVSPERFGAGPIDLLITNQTGASQQITLETRGGGTGLKQSTAPINPRDTAEIKADLSSGHYAVRVSAGGIHAATLRVGAERPSAQNQLLQP
jgi:hypothetical protein